MQARVAIVYPLRRSLSMAVDFFYISPTFLCRVNTHYFQLQRHPYLA